MQARVEDQAVRGIKADFAREIIGQGAVDGNERVGEELITAGEQDIEELEGCSGFVEGDDDLGSGHQTAQVEFDPGIINALGRVGRPTGRRVTVHDIDGGRAIGTDVANTAAEAFGIADSVDIFAHG